MKSRHGFLTADHVTPYVVSAQSTKDGPLVVRTRFNNDCGNDLPI